MSDAGIGAGDAFYWASRAANAEERAERAEAERDALRALLVEGRDLMQEHADEIERLRALLREHRDFPNAGNAEAFRQWHKDWCARRDAALKEKP